MSMKFSYKTFFTNHTINDRIMLPIIISPGSFPIHGNLFPANQIISARIIIIEAINNKILTIRGGFSIRSFTICSIKKGCDLYKSQPVLNLSFIN